jgi:ribonuclease PH
MEYDPTKVICYESGYLEPATVVMDCHGRGVVKRWYYLLSLLRSSTIVQYAYCYIKIYISELIIIINSSMVMQIIAKSCIQIANCLKMSLGPLEFFSKSLTR